MFVQLIRKRGLVGLLAGIPYERIRRNAVKVNVIETIEIVRLTQGSCSSDNNLLSFLVFKKEQRDRRLIIRLVCTDLE
jgi:hypothetical protein